MELHQKDNDRLLETLKHLRDIGNTVIVVEHDHDAIMAADFVLDIGPGAGIHGGEIIAKGTPIEIAQSNNSLTGKYLSGEKKIEVPKHRQKPNNKIFKIINATGNNLKGINFNLPVGLFNCVTGVSGSGKSTLVNNTLYHAIAKYLYRSNLDAAPHDSMEGPLHRVMGCRVQITSI